MQYQYIPYIWPLMGSALASLSLGVYALLRRRKAKGAGSFILSMLVVTLWSVANAFEMSSVDFATKLFWANVQYFAYCYSPVTLLALCMEFTGFDGLIKNRKILWFAVIPTIIILLVWTDGFHGLIRYDMSMDYSGTFPVIAKKYGPVFLVHAAYSQFLNIFAWVLLIKTLFFRNTVYRRQASSLLLGLSLIILPNILYILKLSPIKRFDVTPLFFGPAGLIVAWGIFRYRLFDVIPVAWATVIKTMEAGVMVLDLQNRVLDINPAFEKITGCTSSMASVKPVEEVCERIPELLHACKDTNIVHQEFSINAGESVKVYEARLSPLTDNKGMPAGRLVVAYDITQKKQEQQAFLKQQWEKAVRVEKERHARDLHDNLGQVLGFISLQAQGIRQELINAGVGIVSDKLDKLVGAARSANSEIREYIRNARNEQGIEEDFITALKRYVSDFEEQTGVKTSFSIPFPLSWEQLDPNIRIHILNIVREALNNTRKHAQAENVTISFLLTEDQLCITAEDDGKGFDLNQQASNTKTRFGLSIMRERALEIGAKLEIKSAPGKGCRITLHIPLKEEEKNAG